jgi:hypothetical protein
MTLIEFARETRLHREQDRPSHFPIAGNGPPGTFVVFPDGLRVSLPTDQIVFAEDGHAGAAGARVGFGGMSFGGVEDSRLIFHRVRDLLPEEQLSPARSWTMILEPHWVSSIQVDGRPAWPLAREG